jgi:3-oxoadipate enol-lactonase
VTVRLALVDLTGPDAGEASGVRDLVVLGPSLGTSARALWSSCAAALGPGYRVLGWDLPGHGVAAPVTTAFTVADLGDAVLAATRAAHSELGEGARLLYAGVSLGGAVGLQLAVSQAEEVDQVVVICSGAQIGDATGWRERAALVRRAGTPVMVEGSATRWFAPGFIGRDPTTSTALLWSLQNADRFSYARCCEALADYDVRAQLRGVRVPVLAVAGSEDAVAPPALAQAVAAGVPDGSCAVVAGVAHLAPAEAPAEVARLLRDFFAGGTR